MIGSASRTGWQTTLADLALILFMVTAAALADRPSPAEPAEPAIGADSPAAGEPIALYRAGRGAPPLSDWLSAQPRDERQHLTIVARHGPDGAAAAAQRALLLERDAASSGYAARIVIEPGQEDAFAILDFDGRRIAP